MRLKFPLGWQAIIRAWLVFRVGRATAPRKFKVPRKRPSPSDHTATLKGRSGFVYLNSTRQSKERNWWKRDDRGQSHPEESTPTRSTLIAAKEAHLNEDGRQDLKKETPKHATDGRNAQERSYLGGLVHWYEYLEQRIAAVAVYNVQEPLLPSADACSATSPYRHIPQPQTNSEE